VEAIPHISHHLLGIAWDMVSEVERWLRVVHLTFTKFVQRWKVHLLKVELLQY